MTGYLHNKQTDTRHLYKADAISFVYNAVRERNNQAVTNFGVRFSDFVEKIFQFSLTFIYIASRFWGRMIIFCRRLNFANFSVKCVAFSTSPTRFALNASHLAQVLQDLPQMRRIWLKCCKICLKLHVFDVYKSIFKRFFLPVDKPKTGSQVVYNANSQCFLTF